MHKFEIYFTTPLYPDSEDAEGWVSEGADGDDAFKNLYEHFKTLQRGVAQMTFYKTQIIKNDYDHSNTPKFKQIQ